MRILKKKRVGERERDFYGRIKRIYRARIKVASFVCMRERIRAWTARHVSCDMCSGRGEGCKKAAGIDIGEAIKDYFTLERLYRCLCVCVCVKGIILVKPPMKQEYEYICISLTINFPTSCIRDTLHNI